MNAARMKQILEDYDKILKEDFVLTVSERNEIVVSLKSEKEMPINFNFTLLVRDILRNNSIKITTQVRKEIIKDRGRFIEQIKEEIKELENIIK